MNPPDQPPTTPQQSATPTPLHSGLVQIIEERNLLRTELAAARAQVELRREAIDKAHETLDAALPNRVRSKSHDGLAERIGQLRTQLQAKEQELAEARTAVSSYKLATDLIVERLTARDATIARLTKELEEAKRTMDPMNLKQLKARRDTKRLDWLESHPESGCNLLEHKEPNERGHCYFNKQWKPMEGTKGGRVAYWDHTYGPTVRAAIDAAIATAAQTEK